MMPPPEREKKPSGYGRPRSCPMRRSDSDSSGKSLTPTRQYRTPSNAQTHGKFLKNQFACNNFLKINRGAVVVESMFEVDSSTESAEASPEVNHRVRKGPRRGTPSR